MVLSGLHLHLPSDDFQRSPAICYGIFSAHPPGSSHPYTAPVTRPRTMYRQIGQTSSSAGSTASVVPALSSVHVTSGFVDTDASVTGRVRVCGDPSTSIENRNSLYESMNANSPV